MKKDYDLGRGISALFSDMASEDNTNHVDGARDIPLQSIKVNPDQPRKEFSQEELKDLADSIKVHGVVQPIVVRPKGGFFEIVAGERRYRAAQRCGLPSVPALVKNLSDKEGQAVALIENVQRSNLTPIEEANAFAMLIKTHKMTQEDVAKYVGKTRSYISNAMRLLTLPEDVRTLVQSGGVTAGHARALVGREDASVLAKEIVDKKLTVRDVERMATSSSQEEGGMRQDLDSIERSLSTVLQMGVKVVLQKKGGRVEIAWENIAQLESLLSRLYES